MNGIHLAGLDEPANKVTGLQFHIEINGGRGAFLAAMDFAQVDRLTQVPGHGTADHENGVASFLNRLVVIFEASDSRPTPPMAGVGGMAWPLVSL